MNCKKCGKKLLDGAAFCIGCGAPVEKEKGFFGGIKIPLPGGEKNVQPVAGASPEIRVRKQLPKPLWIKGCPVIFSKCVIADRPDGSGEINLTIQVMNVSDKEVEAIYYEFKGMDVLNEVKCDIKNIAELDMCIKPGKAYTLPGVVNLPDKTIRKIKIIIRHVCFTDETIWHYEGEEPLEGIDLIFEEMEPEMAETARKVREKKLLMSNVQQSPSYIYYPQMGADYWMCSCGHFNTTERCPACGITKDVVFAHFTREKLLMAYEEQKAVYEATDVIDENPVESGLRETEILPIISKQKTFCQFCGAEAQDGDKFCFSCGKPL